MKTDFIGSAGSSRRCRSTIGNGTRINLPFRSAKYPSIPASQSTSSSSRRVNHLVSSTAVPFQSRQRVLSQAKIREQHAKENAETEQRLRDMGARELAELRAQQAQIMGFSLDDGDHGGSTVDIHDILSGSSALEISHAGGELSELFAIEDDLFGPPKTRQRKDYRTRRDRTQHRTAAFKPQMTAIVDAYLQWQLEMGEEGLGGAYTPPKQAIVEASYSLVEYDLYRSRKVIIELIKGDTYVTSAIARYGLIPCAPLHPRAAFTVRLMEVYRVTHNRCPHLSIHSFVKSLCDLHTSPFKPHLSRQFSIAYDLYLDIRRLAEQRVQTCLGRNSVGYRLQHACACCTYKLDGEPKLNISMLYTMDGNDSLKRIIRREAPLDNQEGTSQIVPGSSEVYDDRTVGTGFYLSREEVDCWSKEAIAAQQPSYEDDEADDNPCSERWKNMNNEVTAKMWGVFDESGIFTALCRHGFVLLVADMVRSGELSKYPLALVDKMLSAFGSDIALGYDIGCRFGTTLNRSPLGAKAKLLNHRCLVGAFHGHAHNRLCQTQLLAYYVKGLGLEDLETCERLYSKSNALACTVRYASVFHRRQAIAEFLEYHNKYEVFPNLSTFLLNNYKQAIAIIQAKETILEALKEVHGSPEVVHEWLAEERAYLLGLFKEPLEETLEMEYYTLLVTLQRSKAALDAAQANWSVLTPHAYPPRDKTASTETNRRHLIENYNKDLNAVQVLERKMGIIQRWMSESSEWSRTADLVSKRKYQRCLDALEGLVVARIFELSRMNMSQTGYSLRKHIAHSLQARSAAIRTALTRYNAAAAELFPPRPPLMWDQVVEYAFLADFDLLRDTRQDIRERPWSTPAARLAMDSYFKYLRALEEIERLNVEVPRLATYLRDEMLLLKSKEEELKVTNRALAYQISIHRMEKGRYIDHHLTVLNKMTQLKGYSGGPLLGIHVPNIDSFATSTPPPSTPEPQSACMDIDQAREDYDGEGSLEEEQIGEDEEVLAIDAYLNVLKISFDGTLVNVEM